MGRTKRRRAKKNLRNFVSCEQAEDVVSLNSWLSVHGLNKNEKLRLANFNDTGRGVLTKKRIKSGEELLCLPLNLTINITTLLMDPVFNDIFNQCCFDPFTKFYKCLSFQSLLAFYVVYQTVIANRSPWFIYLKSLPKTYSVPYFLPSDIQPHLDSRIYSVIVKQKDVVESSLKVFCEVLESNKSSCKEIILLKEKFSKSLYEWAYFTVNTRCVYMDLTKLLEFKNSPRTILLLLNGDTNISLCPYLDMINHSPKARNETKLLINNSFKCIPVQNVQDHQFSNIKFSIYTNNDFEAYSQVFICYGDSYNSKLITEYGFIIPSNKLDFVSFDFETIEMYLQSINSKLSQEQILFIGNHGLDKDLYVDLKGLSFNLYALLMVVKYFYKESYNVSKIIYSFTNECTEKNSVNDVIIPLFVEKVTEINKSISKLKLFQYKSVILNNCVELMCQYVNILEKFIKC